MVEVTHRQVATNGISLHVAEAGSGPAVLLCHGFPECWYSWRHQIDDLVEAGYRVLVPDQRGYGRSDAPDRVEDYDIFHLVGDLVGLLDTAEVEDAVVIGHDWGAIAAWHAALFRPDRFRAVAGLSVPCARRPAAAPMHIFRDAFGDRFSYMLWFQEVGPAEAELDADVRETVWRTLGAMTRSDDAAEELVRVASLPADAGWFAMLGERPEKLPEWLDGSDVDVFADTLGAGGFRGPLNWYRNLDRNWELTSPWQGAKVTVPALFVGGSADPVVSMMMAPAVQALPEVVPGLRDSVIIDGAGHWVQQERPDEVSAALVSFLGSL